MLRFQRNLMKRIPMTALWSLLFYAPLYAGAPIEDHAFSDDGYFYEPVSQTNPVNSELICLKIREDGKIFSAGLYGTTTNHLTVAQLNANGEADPSFGLNGSYSPVITSGILNSYATDCITEDEGRAVVIGVAKPGTNKDFIIIRLLSDGLLDTTFGTNGQITIDFGGMNDTATSIARQPDGKYVIAGYGGPVNDDFLAARLNIDGTLDATFGMDGQVRYPISSAADRAFSVAMQDDGKILLAGSSLADYGIIRLLTDGSLDSTFNGTGKATIDINGTDIAKFANVTSDGKILVAGQSNYANFSAARLLSDGTLDTSYGSGGKAEHSPYPSLTPYGAIKQPDDKLIIYGRYWDGSYWHGLVTRLDSEGAIDTGFATLGSLSLATPNTDDAVRSADIDSDNNIYILFRDEISGTSDEESFVRRLSTNGAIDTSFTMTKFEAFGDREFGKSLATDDEGSAYILTSFIQESQSDPGIFKLSSGGTLDLSFGLNGLSISSLPGENYSQGRITELENGNFIYAAIDSINHLAYAILTDHQGKAITSFGDLGITSIPIPSAALNGFLVPASDGGFYLICVNSAAGSELFIAKLTADGSLDESFGASGVETTYIGTEPAIINDVIVQEDGKIVLIGAYRSVSTWYDALAVRLLPNGAPDTSFNSNGIIISDFGGISGSDLFSATKQQADGKLVATGSVATSSGMRTLITRYLENGSLDASFSDDGVIFANHDGTSKAWDILVQEDNKILITGEIVLPLQPKQGVFNRYMPDGSNDDSFGTEGRYLSALPTPAVFFHKFFSEPVNDTVYVLGSIAYPSRHLITRIKLEIDSDLDGTPNDIDAFIDNSAAAQDDDNDGLPDSWNTDCDSICQQASGLTLDTFPDDTDNDGTNNTSDAFPNDPTESTDTDNDGIGDNSDAFPNSFAASTDDDNDGLPDNWNAACDGNCQAESGLELDPLLEDGDNDGISDAEDSVVGDDNPPSINAPPTINLVADGVETEVNLLTLGSAYASDIPATVLTPLPDTPDHVTTLTLPSGRNQINWCATDNAGNESCDVQIIDITPLAFFVTSAQATGEGTAVTITAQLSGDAVIYPVTLPYRIEESSTATVPDDHNANFGKLTINQSDIPENQAIIVFTTVDDGVSGEPAETVQIKLVSDNGDDQLANAVINADLDIHTVTITEENLSPTVTILPIPDMSTNDVSTALTVNVMDPNGAGDLLLTWYLNDSVILSGINEFEYPFDPADYEAGNYRLRVEAKDGGTPTQTGSDEVSFVLSSPAADSGSSGGAAAMIGLILLGLRRRR